MGNEPYMVDSPVVCFTDMPIAAYLETGVRRLERNEKIGLYAIVYLKSKCLIMGQGQSYMGWISITMLDARKAETGNVFLMKRLFL
ncbi:putative cytoplasmic protein [Salmonella enterica subsp. enterica]|uniref:Putative cytoplasmic protein n=1 Tax=Salmonella enterica I TaxID=59201 RepID=A0A3S4I3Q4_SALET|nr:putative cytoplasmic protein [Salmonella enterica subsp. enterica]